MRPIGKTKDGGRGAGDFERYAVADRGRADRCRRPGAVQNGAGDDFALRHRRRRDGVTRGKPDEPAAEHRQHERCGEDEDFEAVAAEFERRVKAKAQAWFEKWKADYVASAGRAADEGPLGAMAGADSDGKNGP